MSYKIYGPSGFKSYFHKNVKKQLIKSNLSIEVIDNGIIAVDQKTKAYGVFNSDLKFVKSSRQVRKNNSQFIPKLPSQIPYIDEEVIYFGNVYPQFGHFLLEHMNRAWGVLDDRYKKAKVVLVNNRGIEPSEYMFQLIQLLGVARKDIIILNETTRFKNVIIPEQGFNIPVYSSKEFTSAFTKIAENVKSPDVVHEKIYVSRTALGGKKTIGEERVQKIFEENGFYVCSPELLSIPDQVALVKNCKVLAGCAGTALHLSLFMPDGGTVIQIKRNRKNKCNAPIQYLMNETKDIDSVFISGSIEEVKADHATSAPQIISVTKYMRQFFNDFDFKCKASDLQPDLDAWYEYKNLIDVYNKEKGSVVLNQIKHLFIKIVSCLVPGRQRRGRFRKWLKNTLKQN